MGTFKPNITDYKILLSISFLNEKKAYPLAEGVYKILNGIEDGETIIYKDCPTFKTLVSYSSKKVSRLIIMLLRYQYLEKIFDRKSNELYLHITDIGQHFISDYQKNHKINLVKHENPLKPTIVIIK